MGKVRSMPPAEVTNPSPSTHEERHSRSAAVVRDVVIGLSDGLTVPFALAAGLSGALSSTRLVVTAGIAEIVAGSIAMGLGGYLAARTERDHFLAELSREQQETETVPDQEAEEVTLVLEGYGLERQDAAPVVRAIRADKQRWVGFMMRFELGLEEPDPSRMWKSALTIALSYALGGLIPLLPYMLTTNVQTALWISVGITLAALFVFGYAKSRITGLQPLRGGIQTVLIGGLAAGAAFGIARLVS
jgi:VIT1/CCC1 family predicted Fe2+/Mn2+ transporter